MNSTNSLNINKLDNFEYQVDTLNKQLSNLLNSPEGIKRQKYILESIQKLQPQKPIEIADKFINITIGLIAIATIGSFIMLFILNNKKKQHWSLNRELTFIDCFYFHCATLSTVGYGDINAVSQEAKLYTILLIIVTMVEVVAVIDIFSIV